MNYYGIIIGMSVFFIIGLFHPIVIKMEYYFTKKSWPVFLVSGIGLVIGSLFLKSYIASTLLCVVGFSCFWSIHELFVQEKRVERGWFPRNPKRKPETNTDTECTGNFAKWHHHKRKINTKTETDAAGE